MDQSPVVVVALKGGLGNQLFQYAAGITAARQLGASLAVHGLNRSDMRLDELLGIDLDEATPEALRRLVIGTPGSRPARAFQRIRRRWHISRGSIQYLRQPPVEAFGQMSDDALRPVARGLYLDGYFQHPSWFGASMIEIAVQIGRQLEQIATADLGRGATVISVRRGDYVRLGWDLPLDYYEHALELLPPIDGPVWVIGDDELVIELLGTWLKHRGLRASSPPLLGVNRFLSDLTLLSTAERVVMSNSTYCWWGVTTGDLVSPGSGRTIIAPAHWLPREASSELIRPGWQTVS